MRYLIPTALLAVTLTACGSGGGQTEDTNPSRSPSEAGDVPTTIETGTDAATPTSEATTAEAVDDANELADLLQAAVPEISDRVEVTEDNDSNDLIGRPNQYDQAVFLADERLGCEGPGYNDLATDCGAKIERWPSPEDAQARLDDIQNKLKTYGLGAEYDYIVGRLLVRVAADLKPSEAKVYEDALP